MSIPSGTPISYGDHHGNNYEREVIECGPENFVAVVVEESPGGHLRTHAEAPRRYG